MSFTEVGGTDLQILPETGIGSLDTGFRLLYEHDLLVGDELSSAKIPIETSLFDGEMADGLVECLFIRLSGKTVSSVERDGKQQMSVPQESCAAHWPRQARLAQTPFLAG
jgi:hypothetical protein